MIRRVLLTATTALLALLVLAPIASAATSDQIHKDAADCVLDGDYTLQELRAADRNVGADQREYGCWDEPYAAYLRQLAAPKGGVIIPPVVKPKDTNKNGKIDASEKQAAALKNAAVIKKLKKRFGKDRVKTQAAVAAAGGDDTNDGDGPSGGTSDKADRASTKDDSDGTPWWLALLLVPLAILAFGAYRLQRDNKRKRALAGTGVEPRPKKVRVRRKRATSGDDLDGPSSSYGLGPDER